MHILSFEPLISLMQNSPFLMHNSSFLVRNSPFLMQNFINFKCRYGLRVLQLEQEVGSIFNQFSITLINLPWSFEQRSDVSSEFSNTVCGRWGSYRNDEFCIQNDEICIKIDEICIKNDEICIKIDESCIESRRALVRRRDFGSVRRRRRRRSGVQLWRYPMMNFAFQNDELCINKWWILH